ncbi:hypothetical protein [Pseudoduganella chitinolytica]|uniref:hypothetical protein n=1 Tax=Pseudoduganella chitinolytica TaxID=34070 RepID=UPI003530E087
MNVLTNDELSLVHGAMGSRGQTVPMSPAMRQCQSGAGWGILGGAIAGASGGFLGVALGAIGGLIAGGGSSGCFAVPQR